MRAALLTRYNTPIEITEVPDPECPRDGAVIAGRDMTEGGAHVSLNALGITDTFSNSLKSHRKMGRHVQIGMPLGRHATPERLITKRIGLSGLNDALRAMDGFQGYGVTVVDQLNA